MATKAIEKASRVPSEAPPFLDVKGVSKSYFEAGKEFKVLANVGFELDERDFVCIVSPSGSGKRSRSAVRATAMSSTRSRSSQKSSACSEATRQTIRCTIPLPARPRRACGYSKKVRSEPALPTSSA